MALVQRFLSTVVADTRTTAYLAAWMTVRSWMLLHASTNMLFRSPRSTQPYQMLTCCSQIACTQRGSHNPPHTLSMRSTSPMTMALDASQASGATNGTRCPSKTICCCLQYGSSSIGIGAKAVVDVHTLLDCCNVALIPVLARASARCSTRDIGGLYRRLLHTKQVFISSVASQDPRRDQSVPTHQQYKVFKVKQAPRQAAAWP